jgi:aspartate/glutamate racemase
MIRRKIEKKKKKKKEKRLVIALAARLAANDYDSIILTCKGR